MGALCEAIPQSFFRWPSITDIGDVAESRVIPGQCQTKTRRVEPKPLSDYMHNAAYAPTWNHRAPQISASVSMILGTKPVFSRTVEIMNKGIKKGAVRVETRTHAKNKQT